MTNVTTNDDYRHIPNMTIVMTAAMDAIITTILAKEEKDRKTATWDVDGIRAHLIQSQQQQQQVQQQLQQNKRDSWMSAYVEPKNDTQKKE